MACATEGIESPLLTLNDTHHHSHGPCIAPLHHILSFSLPSQLRNHVELINFISWAFVIHVQQKLIFFGKAICTIHRCCMHCMSAVFVAAVPRTPVLYLTRDRSRSLSAKIQVTSPGIQLLGL